VVTIHYHRASVLSRLDPSYYISDEVFRRERELLFGRIWQFFTLKPLLARHNAFVVRSLGGRSIVVQNFHGELRAFENVCLHRQAPLQWESEGVRPLVCRYHAWSYAENGRVDNIPFRDEVYRIGERAQAELCLPTFKLNVIGNLVFINLAADPLPIEDQFAPAMIESLRASSASYDGEVAVTTFRRAFNWKLAYENLRDGNHPRFIHAKTLAKTFSFLPGIDESMVAEAKVFSASAAPSREAAMTHLRRLSYHGMDSELESFQPLEWNYAVTPWQDKIGYFNWLAFPNLHIATATGGHAFTIEHHVPVSAGVTDVILYWVMATKSAPYPQTPAVLFANMLGSERVLSEDFEVMEKVQSALHERAPRAILGDYEGLNMMVESWYAPLMEGRIVL